MSGANCADILGPAYAFGYKKYDNMNDMELCLENSSFPDDTALTFTPSDSVYQIQEKGLSINFLP